MGPENKQEVLELVRRSPLSKHQTLMELGSGVFARKGESGWWTEDRIRG